VTFQLPPLRRYYTTKPDHYISHLVGHEGPGSLLSALKVCAPGCVCVLRGLIWFELAGFGFWLAGLAGLSVCQLVVSALSSCCSDLHAPKHLHHQPHLPLTNTPKTSNLQNQPPNLQTTESPPPGARLGDRPLRRRGGRRLRRQQLLLPVQRGDDADRGGAARGAGAGARAGRAAVPIHAAAAAGGWVFGCVCVVGCAAGAAAGAALMEAEGASSRVVRTAVILTATLPSLLKRFVPPLPSLSLSPLPDPKPQGLKSGSGRSSKPSAT